VALSTGCERWASALAPVMTGEGERPWEAGGRDGTVVMSSGPSRVHRATAAARPCSHLTAKQRDQGKQSAVVRHHSLGQLEGLVPARALGFKSPLRHGRWLITYRATVHHGSLLLRVAVRDPCAKECSVTCDSPSVGIGPLCCRMTTKDRSVAIPTGNYEPTPVPSSSTLIHPWPPLPFSRYWSVK
jgi:hypothetical protein